ncbi:MAG: PDZ domain-containing protein, partial [Nocardioidaceae bacterium]
VKAGSPALRAGVQDGDVVTTIDGQMVDSAEALIVAIRAHRPGERVLLNIERDGRTVQVTVTLGQQTG